MTGFLSFFFFKVFIEFVIILLLLMFVFFFFSFFGHGSCGILANQLGIELAPPALERQSPSHWTASEVPDSFIPEECYHKLGLLLPAFNQLHK